MRRRKKNDKFGGWNEPPAQEQRQEPPDGRPHGGSQRYKDKKNWCRGKIGGRRHTGVIRFGQHSWTWIDGAKARCYWAQYSVKSKKWYHCEHQEICSNDQCRKVLAWSLGATRCPDRDVAPFYDPAWYAARRGERRGG